MRYVRSSFFLYCQVRKLATLFQLLTVQQRACPNSNAYCFWRKYPTYITSLQQQIVSFLFCCKLLPQKIISYTNHFRINYHISQVTTKLNKINMLMLPANQQPLCHPLLIKCLTSCVTLVLEIWILAISETWFILEI